LQNIDESQTQFLNDANLRIADCYFITKELEKSIEYYNLAIENKSQNSDYALFKKAEALGGLLQYDSKASSLQKLLRLYPNSKYSGSTTYELASTYFKNLNSKNEALVYYKNLIKDYPKDRIYVKKAMLDIGLLYNNMGQTEDAINSFKEFIAYYKGTKESKDALKMLQSIYIETNRADEYLAYAKDLGVNIAITEQDSILYYSVENTYMQGDCEKAIKGFNDYLNRFETGAFVSSANYFLGDCYFKSSAFDKALMHFENVAEMPVSGFTEDALSKMAYIYYHKKYDYEKALAAYKRLKNSTEYKNTERQAKLGILNSEYKLNNYAEVFSAADAVLNMENPEKRHRTLAFMLKAKSALALGYDSLAKESFTNVVFSTNSEESAEARYNLAYIAYKGEEYDKAESYIFDIIEQDPSYEYWVAKAFILSADIFVDTDNRHQAKATLQSIVDNYKGDQALIKEAQDKLDAINERIRQEKENIKDETPVEVNFSEEDLMLFDIEKQESELELEEEIR
jgi:TolA-binding protein